MSLLFCSFLWKNAGFYTPRPCHIFHLHIFTRRVRPCRLSSLGEREQDFELLSFELKRDLLGDSRWRCSLDLPRSLSA